MMFNMIIKDLIPCYAVTPCYAPGNAFRTVKTRWWVSNWAVVETFIEDNNAFELVKKRIAQVAMKNWMDECPYNLPPSLNLDSLY